MGGEQNVTEEVSAEGRTAIRVVLDREGGQTLVLESQMMSEMIHRGNGGIARGLG